MNVLMKCFLQSLTHSSGGGSYPQAPDFLRAARYIPTEKKGRIVLTMAAFSPLLAEMATIRYSPFLAGSGSDTSSSRALLEAREISSAMAGVSFPSTHRLLRVRSAGAVHV